MTDRISALTVVLTDDIRDDDVQCIVDAILMVKGVCSVDLNVADMQEYISRSKIRYETRAKLIKAIEKVFDEDSE